MIKEELVKIWQYSYYRPDGVISYCNSSAIEHMLSERKRAKQPQLDYFKNKECPLNPEFHFVNGRWYRVSLTSEVKNDDWFINVIHQGMWNEVKYVCKMINLEENVEEGYFLGEGLDGEHFTCGFHNLYKIEEII